VLFLFYLVIQFQFFMYFFLIWSLFFVFFFICLNSFIKVLLVFYSTFQSRFMLCYFCLVFSSFFFFNYFLLSYFSFQSNPLPCLLTRSTFFTIFLSNFVLPLFLNLNFKLKEIPSQKKVMYKNI